MRSPRILAALLAADMHSEFRHDWVGRFGGKYEIATVDPPRAALRTDVYTPVGREPRKGLLVLHGLHEQGKDEPRLGRLAAGLAKAGLQVIVPDIAGFRRLEVSAEDLSSATDAIRSALALVGHGLPLSAIGVSYAAGPLLVASARKEFAGALGTVYSLGGFFDMRNVFAFAFTGRCEFLGESYRLPPDNYVRRVAINFVLPRIHEPERARMEDLAERVDREACLAAAADPTLSLGARHFAELLASDDPDRIIDLARKIDNRMLLEMWKVSPASIIPEIRGRVLAVHSTGDFVIPFTESQRLSRSLAGRGPTELVLLRSWTHMDRGRREGAPAIGGGALRVYRLIADIIGRPERPGNLGGTPSTTGEGREKGQTTVGPRT